MIIRTLNFQNLDLDGIYKKISNYLKDENLIIDSNICYNELVERENVGSIKVYPDLYLPHIVSSNFLSNIIIRVRNDKYKFLFILFKDSSKTNITKGINIVGKLLDRNFVDEIFLVDDQEFEAILKYI